MNRYIYILISLLFGVNLNAQVLHNVGKINVAGGFMVISGSYQNESTGGITLDGKITVSGNWTNNGTGNGIDTPGTNGEVIFNGTSQTIGGSASLFDFEKLTINSGSTTQVAPGKGVTTYGAANFTSPLVLKTTTTAYRPQMATFINKSTVTGNITMELSYTSTGSSSAGTGHGLFFSSPISNATTTIFDVASGANSLWYQDAGNSVYVKMTANATPLTVAKGYIIRSKTTSVLNFTGIPNVATETVSIPRAVPAQYYLVGNPYQSGITWSSIDKTDVGETVWYRTCTTDGKMCVDTWNEAAGEGTAINGTAKVDGNIPAMQSFWVQSTAPGTTGSMTIKPTDRTHSWGSAPFLRSKSRQSNDILRMQLYTGNRRDELIVIQADQAENGLDKWDSNKFFLNDVNVAEFYSVSTDKHKFVINSIKPVTQAESIPLGLTVSNAGSFKFVADLTEVSNKNNIFLEDKLLNTKQDLSINPEYTFSSEIVKDTIGDRFALLFLPRPILMTRGIVSVCTPETGDLTQASVTAGSQQGLVYTYWTDASATVAYSTPSNAESGTYYIKALAANGAYIISSPISVQINPLPIVTVNSPAAINSPATVDLTSPEITLGSSPNLSFTYWLDALATMQYSTPQFAGVGNYYIKGTTNSTGCYAVGGPVNVAASTTGIPTELQEEIKIYSNDKTVYIENCIPKSQITIIDMVGHIIYTGISESNREVIPCNFKTGLYVVKVVSKQNIKSQIINLQ